MKWNTSYLEFKIMFWICQFVGILAIGSMFIWVFCYRKGLTWHDFPKQQFNWHVLCMSVGMVYLAGNAILTYRALRYMQKKTLKLIHASLGGVVFLLFAFGLYAIVDAHNYSVPPKPNFFSLHSWFGVAACVIYVSQLVLGTVMFLYPTMNVDLRIAYMPFHVFLGMFGFVLSTATLLLGLFEEAITIEGYSTFAFLPTILNLGGCMFVVFAAMVVYMIVQLNFKRKPLSTDS